MVDEHALLVLAVEDFLEIVGFVDFRPAIPRIVAHERLHHLVLRYEAASAVGTLRFAHFAEPVIARIGFGDICLEMLRVDFVEWVDEEIDIVVDHGDAERIEAAANGLELSAAVDEDRGDEGGEEESVVRCDGVEIRNV